MRATSTSLRPWKSRPTPAPAARRSTAPRLQPRVQPIYWGAHFRSSPLDVVVFDEFLRSLFRSSWMSELGAQGVAPARLLTSFVPRRSPPPRLTRTEWAAQVQELRREAPTTALPHESAIFELFVVAGPRVVEAAPSERCLIVPVDPSTPDLLEVYSRAISRALAGAFVDAAQAGARRAAIVTLDRTS